MADEPRPQQKKPSFPISDGLRSYLAKYRRERALPVTYERLCSFSESWPVSDWWGVQSLWD